MPPAARLIDNHQCNLSSGPVPHVGGPILPLNSPNVMTGYLPQARATDKALCAGPPDFIVTGSGSVMVNGLPAARKDDRTMHQPPGLVLTGFARVDIGGPTVGVTLGGGQNALEACSIDAGRGRASGSTSQSYNNCGVESSRQIINAATGRNVSEDALLNESMRHGDADEERKRFDSGGTHPDSRRNILARNGVPSSLQDGTMDNISQAVAERRGVITSHEVSVLWGPGQSGGHAIVVTGVEYDANGNLLNVIMNDTGLGQCGRKIPAAQFQNSLRPGRPANVTNNPVW